MTNSAADLDTMVQQYAETALWSSPNNLFDGDGDEHAEMLDGDYGVDDISPETLAEMRADCADFLESNAADLADMDPGQAGHDFWLTRNHHGVGFWDRGLGELGDRLSDMARPYGEVNLYVGDDGLIYA